MRTENKKKTRKKTRARSCIRREIYWSLLLGECLFRKREPRNGFDKNAVAVICLNICGREEMVGHVPQNISKLVPLYLSNSLLPGT